MRNGLEVIQIDTREAEHHLLQVEELLMREVLEKFTSGLISSKQLRNANLLISNWSQQSQKLLAELMGTG